MVDGKIKKFVLDKDTTEKNLWASNYWMPRKSTDGLYFNFQNPKTSEFHKINLTYVKTNKINPFVVPDPNDRFIADRKKYVNEMILKFMTGKEALSAWNQYIETLNTTFNYKEYKAFTEKSLRDNKIIK
jgi:putative aldouronate transport system substrate-binding protein